MTDNSIHIEERIEETKGELILVRDGETEGGLYFSFFGNSRMVINHIEVSRALRGTGAARMLVDKAVEYARNNQLKIVPACPYAKAVLTKNREQYGDVLV